MADEHDYFSMSDEEFLARAPAYQIAFDDALHADTTEETPNGVSDVSAEEESIEPEEVESEEEEVEESEEEVEESTEPELEDAEEPIEGTEEEVEEKDAKVVSEGLDALYEPFKASGMQVQVESVAQARELMQQGVHFTQKMQELKPHLRLLKSLEANNLLDEGKLNHLIDISKKNPAAIKKLMEEGGLSTHDIEDVEGEYTPEDHQMSEEVHNLQTDLDRYAMVDPAGHDNLMQTLQRIDTGSRNTIMADGGEGLRNLILHSKEDVFDKVSNATNQSRLFNPTNEPWFNTYRRTFSEMFAKGEIIAKSGRPKQQAAPVARDKVKPRKVNKEVSAKRKAASAPKGGAQRTTTHVDIISMSDAEFKKYDSENLFKKV